MPEDLCWCLEVPDNVFVSKLFEIWNTLKHFNALSKFLENSQKTLCFLKLNSYRFSCFVSCSILLVFRVLGGIGQYDIVETRF